MKKSGNRIIILTILMLLLLFLTSCKGRVAAGERPQDTAAILRQVQTGTQGVELSLIANQPPNLLYDQNELNVLVEVRNRGNNDLQPQDCFIQITGFDPNIIRGGIQSARSCAENLGTLEGKDEYNLEGGYNQLEFHSSAISLPANSYEYNPTLNFVTCYKYHTKASPQVCVDPLIYQITAEQKTCLPKDVGMGGGQGAPLGISYVGVNMFGSKATFEINVVNYGKGRVVSPNAQLQNCGQASLEYRDLDKVQYSVQMSGGSLIDCKPQDGFVRLVNNNGKIICSFNIPGASAYETPLLIDLDYGYIQSFQKPIKIIKTPQ